MKILITGRQGTGKTTVIKELQARGFTAYNTDDMPEVTQLRNQKTGEQVDWPKGSPDWSKLEWTWDEAALKELLASDEHVFIGAVVHKQADYYPLFDHIFAMQVDADSLRERLKTHEHGYASRPEEFERILTDHQAKQEAFVKREGAIPLNNMRPIAEVVDDLLQRVGLRDPIHDYSNQPRNKTGKYLKIGSYLSPGIRKVQKQIVPYADDWMEHNRQALKAEGPLWVVIGDSMSQAIGAPSYDSGWVHMLHEELKAHGTTYRVVNLSMSGATVPDVLQYQLPALRDLGVDPDLVTVFIGANDLWQKKHRPNLLQNLSVMLPQLPTGTVVANMLGERPLVREVNALLSQAVQDHELRLADMNSQINGPWRGLVASDHFHPNEKGYAKFVDVFCKVICS